MYINIKERVLIYSVFSKVLENSIQSKNISSGGKSKRKR